MTFPRRALLSVSDKTGIEDCARRLSAMGVELISSGGTAQLLAGAGIPVIEVSDHTGFPEMMDGRVKTLHPLIHGGILGRRGVDDAIMAQHGIAPIDIVIVNLYPFESATADPQCPLATAIENIDIGGPALIRAAAKNHAHVSVLVDPEDYEDFLLQLAADRQAGPDDRTRFQLAVKAFAHTSWYDGAIASWLDGKINVQIESTPEHAASPFPEKMVLRLIKKQDLRYGENPHQHAAFYVESHPPSESIATAEQVQGKPLSYNNIADADAALSCVLSFREKPACVIVKHANPCGVAISDDIGTAYDLAWETDPTSAFGGIIAFNRKLDAKTALRLVERQFVEVIIAPDYEAETLNILAGKPNIRVLSTQHGHKGLSHGLDYKRVSGGLLVQDGDHALLTPEDLRQVSRRAPTSSELQDLLFAWQVVKFVKSNAIVYCQGGRTLGIGAGQMSRVYSARIAAIKAEDQGLSINGSVVASDAFFPFRDGIDAAAAAGVTAVIHPGGSVRDDEVIAAADEHGMAMVLTGIRHFRH